MKIVSGSSNKELAEKIAGLLHTKVSPLDIFIFPDRERRVRVLENVVEEDCIVIQPTNPPVDTNYIELFLIIDALKRSGARDITVVMPYMGYQRQDHVFRSGEAVSLEVMITTLEAMGISRVISFDMHSIKIPEFFHVPLTHLSALPVFAKKIAGMSKGEKRSDVVLVSPDMGGIRRIKSLAALLDDMPYLTIVKNRDLETGKVNAADFDRETSTFREKSLKGKTVMIVDDMISSGHTMIEAARLLATHGANEVYIFVTHAIFSKEAPQLLQNSLVKKICVTDSVSVPSEKRFEKLEILSISTVIAKNI